LDKFDSFSPTDYRYGPDSLRPFLSENAFTGYKLRVEGALVETLASYKLCPKDIVDEVKEALGRVTTEAVYEEEGRIGHDIRALANILRSNVSERARPFVHLAATSYDIIDTARALMYRDAMRKVIFPDMLGLEETLIELARREKDAPQIGRTHGQHAVPITFGFAIAQYVNRWGQSIVNLDGIVYNLVGKFSGATGSYNAASLLMDDPIQFEKDLLQRLGIKPAMISTQIVPPEPALDFLHLIISSFGILANYADDMRHLSRTEIGEVMEGSRREQVGSSTMPHKRNPITFEGIKSAWKAFMPRIITVYMDQISEHQRDLTNSMSQRYIPELLVIFDYSVRRANRATKGLIVDRERMKENLYMSADQIVAEPLQILLSFYGYPDAHERIRQLSVLSRESERLLRELVLEDEDLRPYIEGHRKQFDDVFDPKDYKGKASRKTEEVCDHWERVFSEVREKHG